MSHSRAWGKCTLQDVDYAGIGSICNTLNYIQDAVGKEIVTDIKEMFTIINNLNAFYACLEVDN